MLLFSVCLHFIIGISECALLVFVSKKHIGYKFLQLKISEMTKMSEKLLFMLHMIV